MGGAQIAPACTPVPPATTCTGTVPITIHALGDEVVNNYGYSGPVTTLAPFNQKTVTRYYGFGASQGTGSVTIGGVTANVTSWSDTTIVVTLPNVAESGATVFHSATGAVRGLNRALR